MQWGKATRAVFGRAVAVDYLYTDAGTIVAEVREPTIDAMFDYYHYACKRDGCGDNRAMTDKHRLKRHAQAHQKGAHGER